MCDPTHNYSHIIRPQYKTSLNVVTSHLENYREHELITRYYRDKRK